MRILMNSMWLLYAMPKLHHITPGNLGTLDNNFKDRWIEDPMKWPAHSPDLISPYLMQKLYETEADSILDIRQRLTNICRNIVVFA